MCVCVWPLASSPLHICLKCMLSTIQNWQASGVQPSIHE